MQQNEDADATSKPGPKRDPSRFRTKGVLDRVRPTPWNPLLIRVPAQAYQRISFDAGVTIPLQWKLCRSFGAIKPWASTPLYHAGGNPQDRAEWSIEFYEFRISNRADLGGRSGPRDDFDHTRLLL